MRQSTALGPASAGREEQRAFLQFQEAFELERLRAPLRREIRIHGGQRRVAASMRVPRGCLRRFVEMRSVPTGENWETLESWAADRPLATVTAGMVSLALLAGELPAAARSGARRHLARELAALYRATGMLLPAWLHEELAAEGESAADEGRE